MYCDEPVCLSVCLPVSIYPKLRIQSLPNFVHVTYGRGSVLWQRCETLLLPVLWITPKMARKQIGDAEKANTEMTHQERAEFDTAANA